MTTENKLEDKKYSNKRLSYPTPVSGIKGFLFSLGFGGFVVVFLWFFEPFDINIQEYSSLEMLLFGLISLTTFFLAHNILPLIVPNIYKESNWTIYRQILFYIILSLIIATLNGLFINYRNDLSFNWSNYLLIILQTFAVGIIPLSLAVLFSYYWMYKKMAINSHNLNAQLTPFKSLQSNQFLIQSDIKNETLSIDESTFLFAKSSGNYIEVFIAQQPPKVYRMSLSNLAAQLAQSDAMVRCHRSYLVNTKQIVKVTGNAQGLKLWFTDVQDFVPVSRKYLGKVKSVLAKV